jgi:hypothetical protein
MDLTQGEHWSPAGHVDHLIRSLQPLSRALALPRFLLRWRFGRGGESRPTREVVGRYLELLAGGAATRGRFLPAEPGPEKLPDPGDSRCAVAELSTGVPRPESLPGPVGREVDRSLSAPHPLLGPLTVRELVAWSLYHGLLGLADGSAALFGQVA